MYGMGILKGLGVTIKHFFNTYVDDIKYAGRKYTGQENFEARQGLKAQGAFTVQYPDEKIAVPERFRFVPFLIVNDADHPEEPGKDWCTSCGICAKVCPPQCIWIVRGEDPTTKRPVPEPEAFFIDIDICMNCGYCAEFCPFDAIKMDHDYELASYDRTTHHIHDKERLSKPLSYWLNIAPTTALEEAKDRGSWEHTDSQKAKKKAGTQASEFKPVTTIQEVHELIRQASPAPQPQKSANGDAGSPAAAEAPAAEDTSGTISADERLSKREAALARKRAREAQEKGEG